MARTLTKALSAREVFLSQVSKALTINLQNGDKEPEVNIWREMPVTIADFCADFIREPLFPKQLEFCEAMTGSDPLKWQLQYKNGNAFWGKGSGKDRTIAKLLAYVIYKLLCLSNPQKMLRDHFQCSLGDGAPIDVGNMSINARQAQNVFFNNLTNIVRQTINPKTNVNWFTERGADLREGYGVQTSEIQFPENITAHSLNGDTHTGEGLNLLFGVIDEFGAMSPTKKAFDLLASIRSSVISRYGAVGKVCVLSYKYAENDPMDVLYHKEENDPETFSSLAATWVVNPYRQKQDFSSQYRQDPDKARMTYECSGGAASGSAFLKKANLITSLFSQKLANPVVGNLESIRSNMLLGLRFHDWFQGKYNRQYTVHVDLAKGKIEERGDAAALALTHCKWIKPSMDETTISELQAEGIVLPASGDYTEPVKGVVVDLALQLLAPSGSEVDISEIREFVFKLRNKYGFNIIMVTYDQWGSAESIQNFNANGIDAEILSVDRTNEAYDLFKDLYFKQCWKCYPHKILKREFSELIYTDKGKVGHPERSHSRDALEGISKGSKDVADAVVGASCSAILNTSIDAGLILM